MQNENYESKLKLLSLISAVHIRKKLNLKNSHSFNIRLDYRDRCISEHKIPAPTFKIINENF